MRLDVVLVGEDPASVTYVGMKQRDCAEVGIESEVHRFDAGVAQGELAALVDRLNGDAAVSGFFVQLPLPEGLDAMPLISRISPAKDVDGLSPQSTGRLVLGLPSLLPCTPHGVIQLLRRNGVELAGREAVVVGRSNLVGKPVSMLLLAQHATVTICHSRTKDLAAECRRADVLVAAVGKAKMITADMIKPGAVVIDVGVNRVEGGKLVGDVDFEGAVNVASAITPVPGGVGPMTIGMLMKNTFLAAERTLAK